ncbi:MAG: hypothetical protein C4K60_15835 [Ideonella sp. MAG2]|nr:MAG: hypothetical protein C4K60_15835 [Ideonella sp. MAG2]
MQREHWRKVFWVTALTSLVSWMLMVFGIGIELLPEPDAPSAPKTNVLAVWQMLVTACAVVAPVVAVVSGYGAWIYPIIVASDKSDD